MDIDKAIENAIKSFCSPTIGRGIPHGGQAGYIIYERDGLPFVIREIKRAIEERQARPVTDDEVRSALGRYQHDSDAGASFRAMRAVLEAFAKGREW